MKGTFFKFCKFKSAQRRYIFYQLRERNYIWQMKNSINEKLN